MRGGIDTSTHNPEKTIQLIGGLTRRSSFCTSLCNTYNMPLQDYWIQTNEIPDAGRTIKEPAPTCRGRSVEMHWYHTSCFITCLLIPSPNQPTSCFCLPL